MKGLYPPMPQSSCQIPLWVPVVLLLLRFKKRRWRISSIRQESGTTTDGEHPRIVPCRAHPQFHRLIALNAWIVLLYVRKNIRGLTCPLIILMLRRRW